MPSNHHILCHPLLLLPSIFPSIRVFSNESALCIRWPKYWSFGISPSNENSGLIFFRMDWFDLLAVQGLSRVFSNTTVQKHQFFSAQLFFQHDRKIEHIYNFNKHCQVILKESEFIYAPSISVLYLSSCVVSMCIMKSGYYQFAQYLLVWWVKRCYSLIWRFANY